jgi:hypothetical protein
MIRVVVDTNVVVSAALGDDGLPAAILDLSAFTVPNQSDVGDDSPDN